MSLYLPIKIIREDRLPKKICDRCSCKVNDFYQFCNETIEIQNKLTAALVCSDSKSEETIDLSLVKDNVDSPKDIKTCETGTQTEESPLADNVVPKPAINIKSEPVTDDIVKSEEDDNICEFDDGGHSDNSDDVSLIDLKQKKKKKREYDSGSKHSKKKHRIDIKNDFKKIELKQWEDLMKVFPEGVTIKEADGEDPKLDIQVVKQEVPDEGDIFKIPLEELSANVKTEMGEETYDCCVCFAQCYSRQEMLKHYRSHKRSPASGPPPPAPAPPASGPLRCSRCQKAVSASAWASHWAAHVARDAKPYSCALCEKTFRDTHQILKHGQWHKTTEVRADTPLAKRFLCDLCPQGFTYMRCLLAHRTRTHPEAAARALSLRCGTCGDRFGHVNSLRRHLRQHAGDHHQCHICGKALSSREHLKFHVNIHTGYKPNVCKICGKGFVKKCNLTLHERVHTGEKPHVCSHCGKAFSQRSTLVIHERYHSGARPYVCSLCGRGFVAKGLLTLHHKTTCI